MIKIFIYYVFQMSSFYMFPCYFIMLSSSYILIMKTLDELIVLIRINTFLGIRQAESKVDLASHSVSYIQLRHTRDSLHVFRSSVGQLK